MKADSDVVMIDKSDLSLRKSNRLISPLTSDIIGDRFLNIPYQPLTREEEVRFIKKAQLSFYDEVDDQTKEKYLAYYKEMFPKFAVSYDNASAEEKEKLLNQAIENSHLYSNRFLENNGRLVFSVAKRYSSYDEMAHLFQEGNLGLRRALLKFDVKAGTKFSTYAVLWIRQSINRYLADYSSTIRVPVHRREQIYHLARAEQDLLNQGIDPTPEALAGAMGISLEQLNEIQVLQRQIHPVSLSSTVIPPSGEDGDTTLQDFIADDETPVSEVVEQKIMDEELHKIIDRCQLSAREKKVLYLRYGFGQDHPWTLQEVGDYFGVSRERIRQIELKMLRKLRSDLSLRLFYKWYADSNIDEKHSVTKKLTL